MRKTIFSMFLVLGVLSLSACSLKVGQDENMNSYVNNPKNASSNQEQQDSSVVLNDGAYSVNLSESSFSWSAKKVLSGHTGKVAIKSGQINIANGQMENTSFVMDMTTISDDDNSEALVNHLNSADFFDTANFPEANLNIISISGGTDNQYNVEADLTIKGITNRISFPAEIVTEENLLTGKAFFEINRTLWDIRYNSASVLSDLGDKAIDDMIQFKIEIKADKTSV